MATSSLLLCAAILACAHAIALPSFIASSMVLQRLRPNILHGTDTPNAKLQISLQGNNYPATADATGKWSVTIPTVSSWGTPFSIVITSDKSQAVTLSDVIFGDVVLCSGQSNMELSVSATVNQSDTAAESVKYAANIRLLQVGTSSAYYNVTTPQDDFKPSIPWTRASPTTVPGFSALCYFYAMHLVDANPDMYFGLIDSSWGGTAIEPWMDPTALHQCGEENAAAPDSAMTRFADPGLPEAREAKGGLKDGPPSLPSTLYNAMIAPLRWTTLSAFLWYQGESNAGNPVGYEKCFPAFIQGWRHIWDNSTHHATDASLPFFFVQLSSWPSLDTGIIATQRYAQQAALTLPKVGMAVAADLGDPASPWHPIHPPWKSEVGRRVGLAALNILYGQTAITPAGPALKQVAVDLWQPSWGNFHYGFGSGVCSPGSNFLCFGVRLRFDQPVALQQTYGMHYGFPTGFEIFSASGVQFQPASLTGLIDQYTVQLNSTWTFGDATHNPPAVLRYAWHDYPAMLLFNSLGQPVVPFNVSLSL